MLIHFNLIPERHGQSGQMDRIAVSVSHISVLTRDKKQKHRIKSKPKPTTGMCKCVVS